jgi:hypothetical protein
MIELTSNSLSKKLDFSRIEIVARHMFKLVKVSSEIIKVENWWVVFVIFQFTHCFKKPEGKLCFILGASILCAETR